MRKIFYPDSIVVIGVSEREDNLAANIVRNLLTFGYAGDLHAVGLRSGQVQGVPILTSVEQLPTGIDLAVILTPADSVPGVLDACGRQGIRRAVIESGGFGEYSPAGRRLEQELIAVARRWSIRFVGPNCISAVNMEAGLCLPFILLRPESIKSGPVSVLAQSGGVSITYLALMSEMGPGINKVVSMGNKTDLDELDYLQFLLEDPGTEIICLYLESIEEGRRLIEMCRSADKPVIIQKANVAQQSSQVAYSHTAALANDDQIVDAALRQAGIPRAASFGDAVALAQGFRLPTVRGNRMVVVSRSGGHAVVAADLAAKYGFDLIPIPDEFLAWVQRLNRADVIALTNPLDLGAILDFQLYGLIVREVLHGLNPDALLLIQTSSIGAETEMTRQLGQHVRQISQELDKPVAFCVFTHAEEVAKISEGLNFPVFTEIEDAIRAFAASRDRYGCLARPASLALPEMPRDRPHAVTGLLGRDGALAADMALGLVAAYGIPTAEWAVVESVEGALVAAGAIGFPVALKVVSPEVVHKSDVGGVALDVENRGALRAAYTGLLAGVRRRIPQLELADVLVQRMLPGGREVILGGKRDPTFGPVVMFGLGGIYAELFRDVVFRLAPLTAEEAGEMISEVRGIDLLGGVRGEPPRDIGAVVEALVALSQLMVECPEVQEIDVNPLLVFERGAAAVDARAIITQVTLD